ncbi:MAG TPA: TPM domain-containing protein, partial [Pyrinomonadaceae bacterium]
TVKTTEGREIFDYGMAIARRWGIGPANDDKQGLLLLIAVDDHKYQTLTSRHLQGELTDSNVGSIQRQFLIPALRAGNYGQGLTDTVRAYIDTLAMERGFSTATIYQGNNGSTPRKTAQPQTRGRPSTSGGISSCVWIVIIIFVLIFLFGSRGRGGGGSGCLNMLFLGSLLSNVGRGGWSSGGWSGGGFGGSSGGGGGGFGGFGGGGDFDGGGAGGSW